MSVIHPPYIQYRVEYTYPDKPDLHMYFSEYKDIAYTFAKTFCNNHNKSCSVYEQITSGTGMKYQTITTKRTVVEPDTVNKEEVLENVNN